MKRLLPGRWSAALQPEAATGLELPGEITRESRRRVRMAAAIGSAGYAVFLACEAGGLTSSSASEHRIALVHNSLGIGLCLSLLLVSGLRRLSDRQVLGVALGIQVLLCLVLSVGASWAAFVRTGQVQILTWVVPIIILFPLLVRVSPRTTLITSVLCALTTPLALWILALSGHITVRMTDYLASGVTGAVAVGIASVASWTAYGAGRQVAAARRFGSYELLDVIGQGGMGEVWKARHMMLARPAAIKLILPESLQGPREERDAAVRRFTQEARVTSELCSAHTVHLFDFGVSEDASLYYVMELLEGINAEHFIYQFGPLEPRRAVFWLRQACHSLAEAHARGLIHRDIKPSNIFACRYGQDADFVKVLDFGLSKPAAGTTDPQLTVPGAHLGTPGYMSPEQIFGMQVSPATDLYALGCVAYWLLTGAKPFEADTGGELLWKHAHTEPPPMTGKTAAAIPARLEALVISCLAKDPAARPSDAGELSEHLDACLDGARWSHAEARAWWEKNLPAAPTRGTVGGTPVTPRASQ
jgi:serine/threonine-protein kinase